MLGKIASQHFSERKDLVPTVLVGVFLWGFFDVELMASTSASGGHMVRRLEMLANVSIVAAALVFCATMVKDRWTNKAAAAPRDLTAATEGRLLSSQLNLPGVRWDQASKTLVMALSTQCHFCQESTPFYKALTTSPSVTSKRVSILMVFPQPQNDAETFVRDKDINGDRIVSMPLQKLGITSTPTLLLVDRSGKVERLWIGVLSHLQQKDLLEELAKLS